MNRSNEWHISAVTVVIVPSNSNSQSVGVNANNGAGTSNLASNQVIRTREKKKKKGL